MIIHALGKAASDHTGPAASAFLGSSEELPGEAFLQHLEGLCVALGIPIDVSSPVSCRNAIEAAAREGKRRIKARAEQNRREQSGLAGGRPVSLQREEVISTVIAFAEVFQRVNGLKIRESFLRATEYVYVNERRSQKIIGNQTQFAEAARKSAARSQKEKAPGKRLRDAMLGKPNVR
jgi:hypothetical protein